MTPFEAQIARARETGNLGDLTEAIPYARVLHLSFDRRGGALVGKMTYSPTLIGNPALPALHGGTLGALLESTAIVQLLLDAESGFIPKTINITVNYLRSGRPVDTFARGSVVRHGKRVANVHVQAWQDDPASPIATASAHFLVRAPR